MRAMTVEEMEMVEGGGIGIALAILAIDLGLIATMWAVYMNYQLQHDNPYDVDAITHG